MNTMERRDELAHLLEAVGAKLLLGKTILRFDWERDGSNRDYATGRRVVAF